jgi:hypothetical protein
MNTATAQPAAVVGEVIPREVTQAAATATATLTQAEAWVVDSAEMYALAAEELRDIATKERKLEEARLGITRPMDEAKRRIMDLFRAPAENLAKARKLVNDSMLEWKRAEDKRIAREQAAAEAAAAEERRLARIAADEAQAKADAEALAAQEAAEAANAAGDHQAAEEAQQRAEEAAQAAAEAAEAVELAEVAPPQQLTRAAPTAAGVASRQNWKADIFDLGALVTAAAEGLARGDRTLLGYLQADATAINQVVRALKANARIPGVRAYAETGLSVRSR